MKNFQFRGLEIHSSRMWQWAQVERSLDFMEEAGLNALIFHQNDIIEHLVFPKAFFSYQLMRARWSVRMHAIYQNRHYIRKVAREAKERGIAFYLEVKEISFVDHLVEVVPDLRNPDGSFCPANPFWWRFIDIKMRELLDAVPDLEGVIVSPGTRESRVSISTNTCRCPRCREIDPAEWYKDLLGAMRKPLAERAKTLAVRDFAFTADQQSLMIEAARRCADDIVISLKNTPHDWYPTFVDNPRIGHTDGLRQWVEFDTWGQNWGLGFFPVSVAEDMKRRMAHAAANGVEGIFLRSDWEVLTDASVFNSFNILNLIAGSMLARNVDADFDSIYRAWLRHGLYSPMSESSRNKGAVTPTVGDAVDRLKAMMQASWSIMEKASYTRGHVFEEDGQWIETVAKSFNYMTEIHGRDHWEPDRPSRLVVPTDENIRIVFEEKQRALDEIRNLRATFKPEDLGVPEELVRDLERIFEFYEYYVRGFQLFCHAVFLTRKAQLSASPSDISAARDTLQPLRIFREELVRLLNGTHYPHYVYWLLDESRVTDLIADVGAQLAAIPQALEPA